MRRLVLASRSPRRRRLLADLGRPFEVLPAEADETEPPGLSPGAVAVKLACRKAQAVAARPEARGALVLAADTIVTLGDAIIGKPAGRDDAIAILGRLAGSRHAVITGVCLLDAETGFERVESVRTWVTMRPMTRDEIKAYVDSGEAYDKAGAYAIQETADRYVTNLEGSFTNVVGLPMETVREMLAAAGG